MQLRGKRQSFGVLVVAVALLLPMLILGNVSNASAQDELICEVGMLVADQCVEIGDAPAPAGVDVCPVSDSVFEDAAGCYELVPRVGGDTCPADTVIAPDGLACRRSVEPILLPAVCPAGFTIGVHNLARCARVEPAIQSAAVCLPPARGTADACYVLEPTAFVCSVGVLAGDICVIEGNPPVAGPDGSPVCSIGFGVVDGRCVRYSQPVVTDAACDGAVDESGFCRVSVPARESELQCSMAGEVLDGSDCVLRVDSTSGCPVDFVLDPSGICSRTDDAVQRADDCPNGARGFANGCYILVAKGPAGAPVCFVGELVGSATCVIQGDPPLVDGDGALICAAGFALLAGECIRFEVPALSAPQCPVGSVETVDGYCSKPVANARGAYVCESGLQELLGKFCTISTPALDVEDTCPTGFVAQGSLCTQTTAALFSDLECPPNALGSAGSCFAYTAPSTAATSCVDGNLTPDGTMCYFFPRSIPQDDTVECPAGFAPDDSLGGMCARFEPASENGEVCPEGSRGVPDACYILVAKGPRGAPVCFEGELQGGVCLILGDPPTPGEASCPLSPTVMLDGDFCYELVAEPQARIVCTEDGGGDHNAGPFLLDDGACSLPLLDGQPEICPGVLVGDLVLQGDFVADDDPNSGFIGTCTLVGTDLDICISPPDIDGADGCRREYPLRDGALQCEATFGLIDGACVRYEVPAIPAAECPIGSLEDADGDCRKPVENASGGYFCADPTAALNGQTCVFTAGFIASPNGPLLVCDTGERTVISPDVVVCIIGDSVPSTNACPSGTELQANERCARPVGDARGSYYCEGSTSTSFFDECLIFPASARCPDLAWSPDDSLGGQCARFEPAAQTADGTFFCQDANATLNGRSCVFTTEYIYDEVSPAIACPDLPGVMSDGDTCFELVSFVAAVCPTDTTPIDASTLCRNDVVLVQAPLGCDDGFELVDGQCRRLTSPIDQTSLDCAGADVGAAACDQVIATAQESVSDALVSQRDTMVLFADCAGGTGSFVVTENDTTVTQGPMVEAPAGLYTGSYTVPGAGNYSLEVTVVCPDGGSTVKVTDLVFIDPSGIITDCVGDPVPGATVTLLRSDTADGQLVAVADGDESVMDPAINTSNPTLTNAQGFYRWDVVEGFYQVSAAIDGQTTISSEVLAVPPARTDVNLVFESLNCADPSPTFAIIAGSPEPQPVGPTGPLVVAPPATVITTPITGDTPGLAVTGTESRALVMLALMLIWMGAILAITARHRRDPES